LNREYRLRVVTDIVLEYPSRGDTVKIAWLAAPLVCLAVTASALGDSRCAEVGYSRDCIGQKSPSPGRMVGNASNINRSSGIPAGNRAGSPVYRNNVANSAPTTNVGTNRYGNTSIGASATTNKAGSAKYARNRSGAARTCKTLGGTEYCN
jgi:hypothetical protein